MSNQSLGEYYKFFEIEWIELNSLNVKSPKLNSILW